MDSLVGRHFLNTAAILGRYKKGFGYSADEADTLSIGIDGNTYTFFEDPSDGYRSYMGDIEVIAHLTDALKGAALVNREVIIRDDPRKDKDIIEIIDATTGHIWARLGTDNYDDYYPTCILEWNAMPPGLIDNTKSISEKTAKAIAEAYGYDEVMVYARRNHVEHVVSHRFDVC
jgi:hypothetical protein